MDTAKGKYLQAIADTNRIWAEIQAEAAAEAIAKAKRVAKAKAKIAKLQRK